MRTIVFALLAIVFSGEAVRAQYPVFPQVQQGQEQITTAFVSGVDVNRRVVTVTVPPGNTVTLPIGINTAIVTDTGIPVMLWELQSGQGVTVVSVGPAENLNVIRIIVHTG